MPKFFVSYWYLIFGFLGGGVYFFLQYRLVKLRRS